MSVIRVKICEMTNEDEQIEYDTLKITSRIYGRYLSPK